MDLFWHDVPPDLQREALAHHRDQSGMPFEQVWPLPKWPDVPTRALAGEDDRLFPPELQERVLGERLGLGLELVPGGHFAGLSQPIAVVDRLEAYARELPPTAPPGASR